MVVHFVHLIRELMDGCNDFQGILSALVTCCEMMLRCYQVHRCATWRYPSTLTPFTMKELTGFRGHLQPVRRLREG